MGHTAVRGTLPLAGTTHTPSHTLTTTATTFTINY